MFLFQVVDIMKVNIDKVLERDQKISELEEKAGNITVQGCGFHAVKHCQGT